MPFDARELVKELTRRTAAVRASQRTLQNLSPGQGEAIAVLRAPAEALEGVRKYVIDALRSH
jgi:hypothetical protein